MFEGLLDKLGQLFNNTAIPFEILEVFNGFIGIWEAIPVVVRFTFVFCFGIACTFAILKMLF